MTTAAQTTFRSCNLCEAVCGLAIEHDDRQVISIKGDKDDPLSRGYLCPKALALKDIHADPSRLRQPMQKTVDGFKPISWQRAIEIAGDNINAIRQQHGDDAVAIYLGNPTVHNSGALLFQKFLKHALHTKNSFAATSVDQLPHHFAASQMFGHGLLIPIPDIDRTQHMLILGANPAASNGSMMTAPDVKRRIKAIRERGGKVILIDPRATETSKLVDQHHFIRPGTDAYLLSAMLHVIFADNLVRFEDHRDYIKNIDQLRQSVIEFTPESVADETLISAKTIRQLATELAKARPAVVYGRMGVSTQTHGGICHWLMNAINLVTGNLDRAGGQMFATPAVSLVGRKGTAHEYGRWHSRVRGLPEFEGDLPVSVMAEEMLTPGDGQIRALISNAGNPVLSTPNGRQLDKAIAGLDFFVALDIYINETTRHADLILPSPTGLETDHYDYVFNALAVRNVAKYSPQVLEPSGESLYDWQIMKKLAKRFSSPAKGVWASIRRQVKLAAIDWLTPDRILNLGLSVGPYGAWRRPLPGGLNLKRLKASTHGVDLGELQPRLPRALRTVDGNVDAAPAPFVACLKKISDQRRGPPTEAVRESAQTFALIGRRSLRSNNSWLHNSHRLTKGKNRCTIMMHPMDAEQLVLNDNDDVVAKSRVGEIRLPVEITDSMMPGVVSIPHGYGHDREQTEIPIAEANAGASINDLTDERAVDPLTGNAAFSGQRITISRATV